MPSNHDDDDDDDAAAAVATYIFPPIYSYVFFRSGHEIELIPPDLGSVQNI
jgi:hypothetical protein